MAATGYIDPNFPNPGGPNDATIIIYGYRPALALCIVAVVSFVLAAIAHAWFIFRYRTWYFTPLLVGTLMEVAGYAVRTLSSQTDPYSVIYFVVQYFLIVVAPVVFSATIYTIVAKMAKVYGTKYSPLPPKVIIWVFVVCDVIATIIQVAGAALVGSAYSHRRSPVTPNDILMAGLAFQVFTFAMFLLVLCLLLWRARRAPIHISMSFKIGLFIATFAVYLRTCFRLAETAEGAMSYLFTHEAFFGALEFAPMVVAVFALAIWHPGRYLKGKAPEEEVVHMYAYDKD